MTTEIDASRLEEFAGRVMMMYQDAGVSFLIDVGYRTGLFEAAAQLEKPATSQELADKAGLHERHVREWLGAMTASGIFTYDPSNKTYALPAEHAACLTGDTAANLAGLSQFGTFLARHVPGVAKAFAEGGGVPYSAYRPEFTDLTDKMGRFTYDEFLVDAYLPAADGLVAKLESGIRAADLGCGTGHCINLMAKAFPNSTFVGFDFADDAIAAARKEAESMGLTNATFEVQDVAAIPIDPPFELICAFDAIHDQAKPADVLKRACEALAPGGTFLMVDVNASSNLENNLDNPMAAFFYTASTMHCMQVSLALDGAGLGTVWGRELAIQMLGEAGFSDVSTHDAPPADPFNLIYVSKKA